MDSVLIDKRKGCKDVCIAFSARDTARGKFTFFNVLKDLPAHIIFVNDHANNWYLNGTPDFPSQVAFVTHMHKTLAGLLGSGGRVFMLGSSMGAYAALKYGSLLQADRILALGPESELCIPLGRSVTSMLQHVEGDGDISGLVYKDARNVLIISGNNDIVDMYCASRFKRGSNQLNIRLVTNRTHVVAKYLDGNFGLASIVREFFIDENPDFLQRCELSDVPDPATALALKRFNEALTLRKEVLTELAAPIRSVADSMPAWSMPLYFYGLIAEAQGRLDVSEQYLQRSVNAQRSLGRAVLKLAKLRHADGRHQQALDGLLDLAKTSATWSVVELMSRVYQSLGQLLPAVQVLRSFDRTTLKQPEAERLDKRLAELSQLFFKAPASRTAQKIGALSAFPPTARHGSGTTFSNSTLELADSTSKFECGDGCSLLNATIKIGSNARLLIGKHCTINGEFHVGDGCTVTIGDDVHSSAARVEAAGGASISIGKECRLSGACIRSCNEYQLLDASTGDCLNPARDVILGNRVWLSDNSLVLPGSRLGDDTLLDYGAVVSLSVPLGHCLLAGAPAQIVQSGVSWKRIPSAGPLQLPADLTPEAAVANQSSPRWIIEHGLPYLALYQNADGTSCWLFSALARALLQHRTRDSDKALPTLRRALRHCNEIKQHDDRDSLQIERDVLTALKEQEEADALSSLIASRWPKG